MRDLILEKAIMFMQVSNPTSQQLGLPEVSANEATAQKVLAIVFGLAAAVAILVILIASFNIVTGGGDPEKIARGKKAVIYSLVGLAVALSAEAIVYIVLGGI